MLTIKFDLTAFEEVELVPIGDAHIGNDLFDEVAFKKVIDYILEEPENPKCARICLLNGDLTESVTRHSKGNLFGLAMSPSVQIATAIKYLLPLTETSDKYPQGKILSYCAGNHDWGRYQDTGVSSAESIAVKLGLEDRFSVDGCYCFINVKLAGNRCNTVHTVYNTHLTGGAGTVGGKANKVGRQGVWADVIVGSHFHLPLTYKEDYILPNKHKNKLKQYTTTYLITSAFLKYGDYAQRYGMKPATICMPKIYLMQGRDCKQNRDERYTYTEVVM